LHRDVEDGLVGDEDLRLHGERPRDGDALTLAARELMRITIEDVGRESPTRARRERARRIATWDMYSTHRGSRYPGNTPAGTSRAGLQRFEVGAQLQRRIDTRGIEESADRIGSEIR